MATRSEISPGETAFRFVRDPKGLLIVDLSERLPGRGAWILPDASLMAKAIENGSFARALRAPAALAADLKVDKYLTELSDALLHRAIGRVGLARKSGLLVSGFDTIKRRAGDLIAYITPGDAADDGVRKITSRLEAKGGVPHISLSVTSDVLGRAVGDEGAVHFGLLRGKPAQGALWELQRWHGFSATLEEYMGRTQKT